MEKNRKEYLINLTRARLIIDALGLKKVSGYIHTDFGKDGRDNKSIASNAEELVFQLEEQDLKQEFLRCIGLEKS